MILLKVIFYIIVFFPFLGTAFVDQETVKTRNEETFTEPLKDLAEAEFINNERASGWRSLSITHISDKLQNQCPTSYVCLENVIKEYNKGYKGLEKENEDWMKEKIKELIGGY